jgi:hypothetical protein
MWCKRYDVRGDTKEADVMQKIPFEYLHQAGEVTPDGSEKTLTGIRVKPEFPFTSAPHAPVDTGVADSHGE